LVFFGIFGVFGSSDILKQLAIVIHFWNNKQCFPIEFEPLNMGDQVKDETYGYLETLSETVTPLVLNVY